MSNILVTGGAGYIGSFIVRQLAKEGFKPIILDNFSAGHRDAVSEFEIHEIDLVTQKEKLNNLFKEKQIAGVIHMASFIQMGESFKNPMKYFNNNLLGALNLFEAMLENDVKSLVFSSSAGVYGTPKSLPIKEDDFKSPENPYGETKLQIEKFLKWLDIAHEFRSVSIRYFNAAGAALDGSIGEAHPDESHIIPLIVKAALENREFTIFGDNYKTNDGTCIRDYVHVLDLSRAHTLAIKYLLDGGETNYFNAGVGKGYSNKQLVEEVKKQLGEFNYKIGERRPGDADELVADVSKIKEKLDWQAEYGLEEIIKSAISWHKSHSNGYES